MIRAFNSFQLVTLFAALPFIMGWLWSGPFTYSIAVFWVALVAYLVLFVTHCFAIFELTEHRDR